MRRLLHYLINNIREHLMLYLFLWGLLAIMDLLQHSPDISDAEPTKLMKILSLLIQNY